MLDDLNEVKTFRAILEEGSLSYTARRLGVTLAVVSKRLATPEGRAGVRLTHRTPRTLSPTEAGSRSMIDLARALEAAEGRLIDLRPKRDSLNRMAMMFHGIDEPRAVQQVLDRVCSEDPGAVAPWLPAPATP